MGGNRRFAQVATSDDEDDLPPRAPRSVSPTTDEEKPNDRKRKKKKLKLNNKDDDDDEEEKDRERKKQKKKAIEEEQEEKPASDNEEEEVQEDAKPIGDVIRVSGKGKGRRNHYDAFEYDGLRYDLEDPVLLVPEAENQKPYVAIIKDVSQKRDGSMMVTGQWFYRPEEAEKKGGGNWQSRDARELFYSFHRDEVPAESVMHKCVAHFIPRNKQIPNRKQHPGFIVQKVYDTEQRRLFKLTDKDYEDNKQHEIDLLVQKTLSRLGDLPDIETDDAVADQEDRLKNSRLMRRPKISPLDVSRDNETTTKSGQSLKAETPGSVRSNNNGLEYYNILAKFRVLTGETQRDKWLDKLLQGIQLGFSSMDNGQTDDKEKGGSHGIDQARDSCSKSTNGSQEKILVGGTTFAWPDAAVRSVTALEQASHDTLSSDFQKYNQKMRQLSFNLKSNALLTRRILNGELEPSKILGMSPNELKEGLTTDEIASKEPEEPKRVQLECTACGHTWYASRDEASMLTIDGPSTVRSVGTAPWATAKFEDVEKKLVSPKDSDNAAGSDVFRKMTEAYMPVLDTQKSFNKPRTEDAE
ncbi:hypothetical protein RHGRI_005856 [Rhododendron griersonianum]|uniref:Uncharacterized protein n=1 Tax=Rhododendron griersonianum TaxID=479676 RepID=A0AAV6LDS7_9ERIC|nr:hypothetical protein RHGRI_005856 [Rhododendron griersonianum]